MTNDMTINDDDDNDRPGPEKMFYIRPIVYADYRPYRPTLTSYVF